MREAVYFKGKQIDEMIFPDACERGITQGVRKQKVIPGYKAITDRNTDRVFAIVKSGYNLQLHEDVISKMDELCHEFPEYGEPTREVWMSNHGGRMKTRWTFDAVDFEIGTLSNGEPDIVHPTMETFCSYDTSLAQRTLVGGFRVVCTNGMVVGKVLGDYKRKHTTSLDLDMAKATLANGMRSYSEATKLWLSYADRNATIDEINCYDTIGFNKDEKLSVESGIKKEGKVLKWDDEDIEKRVVEINAWDLFNIYTAESSHRIKDVTRQTKVNDNIAKSFA